MGRRKKAKKEQPAVAPSPKVPSPAPHPAEEPVAKRAEGPFGDDASLARCARFLGRRACRAGRPADAVKIFTDALALSRDDPSSLARSLSGRALAHLLVRDYDECERDAAAAVRVNPRARAAWARRARGRFAVRGFPQALMCAEEAAKAAKEASASNETKYKRAVELLRSVVNAGGGSSVQKRVERCAEAMEQIGGATDSEDSDPGDVERCDAVVERLAVGVVWEAAGLPGEPCGVPAEIVDAVLPSDLAARRRSRRSVNGNGNGSTPASSSSSTSTAGQVDFAAIAAAVAARGVPEEMRTLREMTDALTLREARAAAESRAAQLAVRRSRRRRGSAGSGSPSGGSDTEDGMYLHGHGHGHHDSAPPAMTLAGVPSVPPPLQRRVEAVYDRDVPVEEQWDPLPPPPAHTAHAHARALALKELGNNAVAAGNWMEALRHYTAAIWEHPLDPVFLTNRAYVFQRLGQHEACIDDCTQAVSLRPTIKAYARRAAAYAALGMVAAASEDYSRALAFDPGNAACLRGFHGCLTQCLARRESQVIELARALGVEGINGIDADGNNNGDDNDNSDDNSSVTANDNGKDTDKNNKKKNGKEGGGAGKKSTVECVDPESAEERREAISRAVAGHLAGAGVTDGAADLARVFKAWERAAHNVREFERAAGGAGAFGGIVAGSNAASGGTGTGTGAGARSGSGSGGAVDPWTGAPLSGAAGAQGGGDHSQLGGASGSRRVPSELDDDDDGLGDSDPLADDDVDDERPGYGRVTPALASSSSSSSSLAGIHDDVGGSRGAATSPTHDHDGDIGGGAPGSFPDGAVDWYEHLRVSVPDSPVPLVPSSSVLDVVRSSGPPIARGVTYERACDLVRMCLAHGGFDHSPEMDAASVTGFLRRCARVMGVPAEAVDGTTQQRLAACGMRMSKRGTLAPVWLACRAAAKFEGGCTSEPIADCTAALVEDPECTAAFVVRGACYYALGERDRASADLAHADRLHGSDPWLARVFELVQNEMHFLAGSIAHALRHG